MKDPLQLIGIQPGQHIGLIPLEPPAPRPVRPKLNIDFQDKIKTCQKFILNSFYATLLKIVTFVLKAFRIKPQGITHALIEHDRASEIQKICRKFSKLNLDTLNRVLNDNEITTINTIFSSPIIDTKAAYYAYASCRYNQNARLLYQLHTNLQENELQYFEDNLKTLPNHLKKLLCFAICQSKGKETNHDFAIKLLTDNPKQLLEIQNENGCGVLEQLFIMYSRLEIACKDLTYLQHKDKPSEYLSKSTKEIFDNILKKDQDRQPALIEQLKIDLETKKVNTIVNNLKNIMAGITPTKMCIYDASFERAAEEFSLDILQKPVSVAMLGVEYASFLKQGGLGEAIEGMAKALVQKTDSKNEVRLIFPKYNKLPKHIEEKLQKTTKAFKDADGKNIDVYTCTHEGVQCFFIDHKDTDEFGKEQKIFDLDDKNPNIYGPNDKINKKRFFTFTALASQVLYQMKDEIQVIHLHDWHVAGVALKLHKDHPEDWKQGKIPPCLFTFHNNNRGCQGRTYQGAYNYEPIISALQESGIANDHVNIFAETIKTVDMVATVSENFAKEAQLPQHGEGISYALRSAAKAGKLVGIINGIDITRWNPATDKQLGNWLDPDTQDPVDLRFSPDDIPNIYEKKKKAKIQFCKWLKKHHRGEIDPEKPLVSYIGRFDSYQKGIDKLEEAIAATLKNGGQFVLMGSQEDPISKSILDKLEEKYKNKKGVVFFRDQKENNGKYRYQDGTQTKPGIGSIVRAASDFLFIPSRYEPCGLIQFEGWVFGSLVIGSSTGGLMDTIISKEKNSKHFNGYLFDRDSNYGNDLSSTISSALKDWIHEKVEQKNQTISRVMQNGKDHSWISTPIGFSPVAKQLFIYQKTIQRAKLRNDSSQSNKFNLHEHIYQMPQNISKEDVEAILKEEQYLQEFYSNSTDDLKLDRMYFELSLKSRSQVPAPHAKRIRYDRYNDLGAKINVDGTTTFSVLAPKAKEVKVRLYGNTNNDFKDVLLSNHNGTWSLNISNVQTNQKYHFVINGQLKLDPYGLQQELPPKDSPGIPCSVVSNRDFDWTDADWLAERAKKSIAPKPINIYEVHLPSWRRKDNSGDILNYRALAHDLVEHCNKASYTHVELVGAMEYPTEKDVGCYRVSGFFAPNSRLGNMDDFKYFVDYLHKNKIGVFIDWIPAHFSKGDFSLAKFDGTTQFEPSYLKFLASHRKWFGWDTIFFDFSKKDVREFLISSAAYWINELHVDGLRVDAVKSILYTEEYPFDIFRCFTGNAPSGMLFMRQLNAIIHTKCKRGALTIAEDYSGHTKASVTSHLGGLGFDMKWNINWKDHALDYFKTPIHARSKKYNTLIAAIKNDTFHKMVMALSHDEVQREPLLGNFTEEVRQANLRALYSFMMCTPGKKLQFMGNEFGAKRSWLSYADNKNIGLMNAEQTSTQLFEMVKALNKIYIKNRPLWEKDNNARDIEWILQNDPNQQLIVYRRKDKQGNAIVCLHNFASSDKIEFDVPVDSIQKVKKKRPPVDANLLSDEEFEKLAENADEDEEENENPLQTTTIIVSDTEKPKESSTQEEPKKEQRRIRPKEIFNSDRREYGGLETGINREIICTEGEEGRIIKYTIKVPPLSTVMIKETACPTVANYPTTPL